MAHATYLAYESPVPYIPKSPSTVILYCSDGRLGEHIDDFAGQCLAIDHFDRLAVPGGAACLGENAANWNEGEVVAEQLRFLIDAHDIQRIVLIAHQDCGHYIQRLRIRGSTLIPRQCRDLVQAVERLRQLTPRPMVEAYYADQSECRLCFHRVPV